MLNIGSSDHMTDRRVIEDIKKIGLNNPTCLINSKFCFITKKPIYTKFAIDWHLTFKEK